MGWRPGGAGRVAGARRDDAHENDPDLRGCTSRRKRIVARGPARPRSYTAAARPPARCLPGHGGRRSAPACVVEREPAPDAALARHRCSTIGEGPCLRPCSDGGGRDLTALQVAPGHGEARIVAGSLAPRARSWRTGIEPRLRPSGRASGAASRRRQSVVTRVRRERNSTRFNLTARGSEIPPPQRIRCGSGLAHHRGRQHVDHVDVSPNEQRFSRPACTDVFSVPLPAPSQLAQCRLRQRADGTSIVLQFSGPYPPPPTDTARRERHVIHADGIRVGASRRRRRGHGRQSGHRSSYH